MWHGEESGREEFCAEERAHGNWKGAWRQKELEDKASVAGVQRGSG